MPKFGKTFWGQEFLNALENIDFSNRLSRGRSYASNGSVRLIEFDKNNILARVQGRRPSPYKIKITIPEFTSKEKKSLAGIIKNNPSVLASLLNRKLPEELLDLAGEKNIKIFPEEWSDFDMYCSCPDWAVPCKHLAAVIYIISNEIDLNPFKALELHNFNVIEILEKEGIKISENVFEKIEVLDDNFIQKKPEKKNISSNKINELDFSIIPQCGEKFLGLLSPYPPFHDKDFKEILLSSFRFFTRKSANHTFLTVSGLEKYNLNNCIGCNILIDRESSGIFAELNFENDKKKIPLRNLFSRFYNDVNNNINYSSDSIRVLFNYFLLTDVLIKKGAVIPHLSKFQDNYNIRWIPIYQEQSIKIQLDILNNHSDLVKIVLVRKKVKNLHFNNREEYSKFLISIFITNYIYDIFCFHNKFPEDDSILSLFLGKPYPVKEGDNDIYNSIQLWLNKIQIFKREFTPVLEVEDEFPDFRIGLSIRENTNDRLILPEPFHIFKNNNPGKILRLIKEIEQFVEDFPEFAGIINSSDKEFLYYNPEEFSEFLFRVAPVLKLLGIEILMPKSLKHIIKPSVSLKAQVKENKNVKTYLDLLSILDFQWQVALGDKLVSESQFRKLVKGMYGLVKLKDKFIYVSQEDMNKLIKNLNNPSPVNKSQMLQILFASEYNGNKIEISDELREIIRKFTSIGEITLPAKLKADVRPYQLRGFNWLYKNSQIGFGSILADDMGLGKTLQTIILILKFKEQKILKDEKALIVVPTTLLSNWGKEIDKFAPSLKYHIYHGSGRDLSDFKNRDILLTSYGIARLDIEKLSKIKWHILIIDEAQNIKNISTDQTKVIKTINANIKIALSGTPVENRLSEYWSIFDFTNKGYLGSIKHFTEEYVKPIALEKNHRKLEVFKKITSPFIMRRMKNDKSIISDLPDKVENNKYSSLTNQQAALYESTVKNVMKLIEESDGIERKGLVLKMMTALKQIGNHPYHYLKSGAKSSGLSGKILLLFEILDNILENNEKTLIFTQYKEMGDLLAYLIREQYKTEPLFLHGKLSRLKREEMINDFQDKSHKKIFILSLKAGGTGLNLTAAQNVIHYDLWWNPAVENQATDRAYRIGQKYKVFVYRLINRGTIEEKIDEMLRDKKELADLTVTSGEKWLGELNNKELRELVKLSGERI
ncbi:MAG: DEAD/DEAH box helicase family protein [Ignavibacteria bacterium]|nr:DEAD/DEAH box helicase family protein [Ignavibacteria bacterium]